LHSSSKNNRKWCHGCGRRLVYFKEPEAWACAECGYLLEEAKTQKQQQQQIQQQGIGGVMSVDGLSDVRTSPNRGVSKFRSMDPRARFLKKKSDIDPDLQRLVTEQGVTIIRYEERVVEDNQTLSSEELRQNKE
jgi:hypothetical protein